MSIPVDAEVYADILRPQFLVEWRPGGGPWVAIPADDVVAVEGALEAAAGGDGVAFGSYAESTWSLTLADVGGYAATAYAAVAVRARVGYPGTAWMPMAAGLIRDRRRSLGDGTLTYTVESYLDAMSAHPVASPLFVRRPAFTATTPLSVEDPASPAYAAGLANYLCWQAGGRPAEQAALYPGATFYYDFETALIAPDWTWAAGENPAEELYRLARACGGQVFPAPDGVVTYLTPLDLAESPPGAVFTFTPDHYGDLVEDAETGEVVRVVTVPYVTRRLAAWGEVYLDQQPARVGGSGEPLADKALHRTLAPPNPLFRHGPVAVSAVGPAGEPVALTVTLTEDAAQRLSVTIENAASPLPATLTRIRVEGEAVVADVEGVATVDAGLIAQRQRTISVEQNVYIQSRAHAERLAALIADFYRTIRPRRQLRGCPFDPRRRLNEYVYLDAPAWGLSQAPHRITAIRHQEAGGLADYTLVPVDGLPTRAQLYQIPEGHAPGISFQLGY